MEYILKDREIDENNTKLVGAKATGLFRLRQAGFDIPPFFVVTCDAWMKFCAPTLAPFELQLDRLTDLSDSELINLSSHAQKAIIELKPDKPLAFEITEALEDYGFRMVSVRSSGVAEDLPRQSFSGIYESFIDVTPIQVPDKVKKCWVSAFSVRALKYLESCKGITSLAMAVVVQEMKHFDLAGVIFTLDPVAKQHVLVEATATQTPEPVVSGSISPSRFLFDRYFDLVKKSDLQDMSVSAIRRVAELAVKVEQALGSPQDIEFGVKNGEIVFLQSRPITTLNLKQKEQYKGRNDDRTS